MDRTTCLVAMEEVVVERNQEDTFETVFFLPQGEGRQGEGGLRTQGYFKKNQPGKPLITIVTVVFNGEKFLEETILSIINQSYDNFEYIVIDGGSTDGTLNIIKKYQKNIDYWVSEQDRGISDAFNKAIMCSLGMYINFQGDGDGFYNSNAINDVLHGVDVQSAILISARIQRIGLDGASLYISKQGKTFDKKELLKRMSLPHQGLLTRICFFKKNGLFDIENTYCMDYEHLLRAYKDFPTTVLKDVILANWRADGLGNGKVLKILAEYNKIKVKHKVASKWYLQSVYSWSVIKYLINKVLGRA